MNLLIVGSGKGSFAIRGLQVGEALGARVVNVPTPADWSWADCVVLVKRAYPYAAAARAAGCPVVWDILDCWTQPGDHALPAAAARVRLRSQVNAVQPQLAIGATQAQAEAAGGVYLPHHSWPALEPTSARAHVTTVVYEGNAAYLGPWLGVVSRACTARKWRFLVNPPDLSEADIFVALRGGMWDGWMPRAWKSGVKLVNAMAAGRPVITQDTAAYREIQPPGFVIESPEELDHAFALCADPVYRASVVEECRERAPAYQLPAIAAQYQTLLREVLCPAA